MFFKFTILIFKHFEINQIFFTIIAHEALDKLENDKAIFTQSMKLLQANKQDPDCILCSESESINSENLDKFTDKQCFEAFEDFYQFSLSFVDKKKRDSSKLPIMQCAIDYVTMHKYLVRVRTYVESKF